MSNLENPFSIVKANDFSNEDIYRYWVDLTGDDGVLQLAKPKNAMPMIIKGGKGSGKTHLMRFLSLEVQKCRHDDLLSGIQKDGYIGIYHRFGSLNSSRFGGDSLSEDAWRNIFSYYFEVWVAQILIANVFELIRVTNYEDGDENLFVSEVNKLFDSNVPAETCGIDGLLATLREAQRDIDSSVNNLPFDQNPTFSITTSPGALFFGIPKALDKSFPCFRGVRFLYLLDEMENISKYQQIYINTLIRDRIDPVSIRIGVRSYGIKSSETLADGEPNKPESEFEEIELDDELRRMPKYEEFATDLCLRRLVQSGITALGNSSEFGKFFENPAVDDAISSFATSGANSRVLKELRRKMVDSQQLSQENCDVVISNLSFDGNPIVECAAYIAFARDWADGMNLIDSSKQIRSDCQLYLETKKTGGRIYSIISHHSSEIHAKITKLHQRKRQSTAALSGYIGFPKILAMSKGFPRHLLTICKDVFQSAVFNREIPFGQLPISALSQFEGVVQASSWFYEDAKRPGREGAESRKFVERLIEIYRINRFSDRPKECSMIAFSVSLSSSSQECQDRVERAVQASLLIRINGGRQDKNSEKVDDQFKINPLLCPYAELPVSSRGVLALRPSELEAICDLADESRYRDYRLKFDKSSNIPFGKAIARNQTDFFE